MFISMGKLSAKPHELPVLRQDDTHSVPKIQITI